MANKKILCKGGRIVADASSLIYLSKAGVLRHYCRIKDVFVASQIYNELICKNVNKINDDITVYKQLVADNLLNIYKAPFTKRKSNNLSAPDYLIIELYEHCRAQAVLTDDGKVCRWCKAHNIAYINAPIALLALLYNKMLTYEVFVEKLTEIYRLGRYSQFVFDYMNKLIADHV